MAKPRTETSIEKAKAIIANIPTTDGNKESMQGLAFNLMPKVQEYALLRHMDFTGLFFRYLHDSYKDFKDISKKDVEEAVARIVSDKSISDHKRCRVFLSVKMAFRYALGDGVSNPSQVAWIKYKSRSKEKLPNELLTENEIKAMLNSAVSLRDKAVIALLWDTGMRIGELTNLSIKDLSFDDALSHVQVSGKTGARKIPIAFSVPYIASYLQLRESAKPEDPLIVADGTWRNLQVETTEGAVAKMLRLTAKRAAIKKHIYPHLFRHSRATNLANRLTEPQMRQFFGWTKQSDMPATYVHLSGRDLDDSFMVAIGKKPADKIIVQATEKVCQKCSQVNPSANVHCLRCGMALDLTIALSEEANRKDVLNALLEITKNPKVKDELIKYLVLELKKNR